MMSKNDIKNKDLLLELYQVAFGNYDDQLAQKYFSNNFIQHNPWGRDGISYVKDLYMFNFKYIPYRWVSQNNMVAFHGLYQLTANFNELAIYSVDFWQLSDHKIIEHWDVLQLMPFNIKDRILGGSGKGDLEYEGAQNIFNMGIIKSYLDTIYVGVHLDELDLFLDDQFVFHGKNRVLPKDDMKKYLASSIAENHTNKKIIASGDLVFTHNLEEEKSLRKACADIFRMNEEGKITEQWSICQELIHADKALNEHPYF